MNALFRCRCQFTSLGHAGIVSVASEKLLVRAVLNDGACSHDIDLITTSYGFEPVRDEHNRASALESLEGLD
jgi:hypothetical protein